MLLRAAAAGTAVAALVAAAFAAAPRTMLDILGPLSEMDGSPASISADALSLLRLFSAAAAVLAATTGLALVVARDRLEAALEPWIRASQVFSADRRRELREWIAGNPTEVAALAAITAGGLILRSALLDSPIRYDEAHTFLRWARRGLLDIVSDYAEPNNHVFHTLWVHLSYKLFGAGPASIRLPALLAGTLTIPASFAVARRIFDSRAALTAAALVAASPVLVDFSANARGYSLVVLFFVMALLLATWLEEEGGTAVWPLLAALFACSLWSVPTAAYSLAATLTWAVLSAQRRTYVAKSAAATAIIGALLAAVLYLPAVVRGGLAKITSNRYVQPLPPAAWREKIVSELALSAQAWSDDWSLVLYFVLAVGLCGAFAGLAVDGRLRRLFIAAVVPTALLIAAQRVAPEPRVLQFLLPLALILTGAGVSLALKALERFGGRTPLAAFATFIVTSVAYTTWAQAGNLSDTCTLQRGRFLDAEAIVDRLANELRAGDAIVTRAPSVASGAVDYYLLLRGLPASYRRGLGGDAAVLAGVQRAFVVIVEHNAVCVRESPERQAAFTLTHPALRHSFSESELVFEGAVSRVHLLHR